MLNTINYNACSILPQLPSLYKKKLPPLPKEKNKKQKKPFLFRKTNGLRFFNNHS